MLGSLKVEGEQIGGLTVAFGFSGHGFKLSPVVGALLAEHAMGAHIAGFEGCDIKPYSSERFQTGNELRGAYYGAAS